MAVSYNCLGFVLLTMCAVPIFNLLMLHPIGRHAIERTARNHALLLGSSGGCGTSTRC